MKKSKPKKKPVTETGWAVWACRTTWQELRTSIYENEDDAWDALGFLLSMNLKDARRRLRAMDMGYRCLRTTAKGEKW